MQFSMQPIRRKGKTTSWNTGRNGGYPCFMPSNPRIDQGASGILQLLTQILGFLPIQSLRYQIQQGQSQQDDKIRSNRLSGLSDNYQRQTNTKNQKRSAILIRPMIGLRTEKLTQQVSL